ncbi:MAG: hypothetical protein K2J31_03645, partial [Alistipes sp.]|nr:hypothetical protein [Alistipes sp.]
NDDTLELVIVATGFDDGSEVKIDPRFSIDQPEPDLLPEPEPMPSVTAAASAAQKETGMQPIVPEQRVPVLGARTDRYAALDMEKREPAYRRLKRQFMSESESTHKTVFRLDHQTEAQPSAGESLFGND